MIIKSTFTILAAAAVSLTSVAFAQSADRYGSVMPYHYGSGGGSQVWGSWGPEQQGSANVRQTQAATTGTHAMSSTPKVAHARGHHAFAQAPAHHTSSGR